MSKMNRWKEGVCHRVCLRKKIRAGRVNEEKNKIGREGAMPQTESWREREMEMESRREPR